MTGQYGVRGGGEVVHVSVGSHARVLLVARPAGQKTLIRDALQVINSSSEFCRSDGQQRGECEVKGHLEFDQSQVDEGVELFDVSNL